MWIETINLGAIIHTTTRTYNICKFQAKSENTDAGRTKGSWKTCQNTMWPPINPSYLELGDICQIHIHVDNLVYLQTSSLNIKYGM